MKRTRSRIERRTFIRSAARHSAALMGMVGLRNAEAKEGEAARTTPIIDTHLHCFAGKDDRRFRYHPRAPYQPATAASPQHLLKCMDDGGVNFAVVVHPEPYQDDHRYLEYCFEIGRQRLKGTCLFFCDRPGSVEKLPALVKRWPGRIVAARLHAYAPGRLPPFGSSELRGLWKAASDNGLAMQLHFEPRYAPALETYIREFSKTSVIIDHLGRPFQGTPAEHAVVLRWARFPNTIMKVSSLPPQDKYPHRKIGPVIKQLSDAFSAERMVYGGGFNAQATGDSYRVYRERVLEHLSHLSDAAQRQILGGTAARLFGFVG